jgi:hypothetical protein
MSEQRAVPAEDKGQPGKGVKRKSKSQFACSFCGKKQEQVWRLIAGPGVYICDECVLLCMEMFIEPWRGSQRDERVFRAAVEQADGKIDKVSFGPLPKPVHPTTANPGGERWLHLCSVCGTVNVGNSLAACLHCAEPLPVPGTSRPTTG